MHTVAPNLCEPPDGQPDKNRQDRLKCRQRDRQTERQRQTDRDREGERERETDINIDGQTDKEAASQRKHEGRTPLVLG